MNLLNVKDFNIEKHMGCIPNVGKHFHPDVEFYFLCAGKSSYFIDGKTISMEKGDLIIIPPNTIHISTALTDRKRERILFYLSIDFIEKTVGKGAFDFSSPTLFHINDKSHIENTIYRILNEYDGEKNGILIESLLCEFLIFLSRKDNITARLFEQKVFSHSLSEILDYIKENYAEPITLTSVAEKFFWNPSYLSRLFKENTGFTFVTFLNKYRVINAIKMMQETDKNITEIAFLNGFNSSNSFCKVFKKIMGDSPFSYKKQLTN